MININEAKSVIISNLEQITLELNNLLLGNNLSTYRESLSSLGRGHVVPHWLKSLEEDGVLPNLDGKTVGSVLEMLFVSVAEKFIQEHLDPKFKLSVNPAKGVDIPQIELGIKSPSTNYCTSEPFYSAYERLLGSEYDVVVLLTDYQQSKKTPPLKLQILSSKYLRKSELADKALCNIALNNRDFLMTESEAWTKRYLRFLAFVNQGDWLAGRLLRLSKIITDEEKVRKSIKIFQKDFEKQNKKREKEGKDLIPESALASLEKILNVAPIEMGVLDAMDNWIAIEQKDFARLPNDNEWNRFLQSPLDGKIGMSFALQWRYNFGALFRQGN